MRRLSDDLRDRLRNETAYAHYAEGLRRINRPRFRSLGDARCRVFVDHAAAVGAAMEMSRVGSVTYLMFLMHWLGSFFHTDPRYMSIHGGLTGPGREEERIDAARDAFVALADRHIGERGEIVAARLARLAELEPLLVDDTISHSRLHDALLDLWELSAEERETYPRGFIEGQTVIMSRGLGADTSLGRRTCLILTFVAGVRMHEDPLFPWLRDTVDTAHADGNAADAALLDYARKRLDATLRHGSEET